MALRSHSFNPRPTNWSGDLSGMVRIAIQLIVSIHARPIGRAIAMPVTASWRPIPVSIHARPIGRAIQGADPTLYARHAAFQSTPDQLVGRFGIIICFLIGGGTFQSTPDQLVGRFPIPGNLLTCCNKFQSTPDQLVGRFGLGD